VIRGENGEIAAGVRYSVVYLGETLDTYETGEARTAIARAAANPPAVVMAQAYVVQDGDGTYNELEGPWEAVWPPEANVGEGR
jgi:hypothetical protein